GDLFWQGNNFGQGEGGYNGTGQFTAGAWHRVAAAYDMAADPPVVVTHVDGIKQDEWTANQGLDNARRSLGPQASLCADGDQDERRAMYVSGVQIRGERLSDEELEALGGPSVKGIPLVALPEPGRIPRATFGVARGNFLFAWERAATGWTLESSTD